MQSNVKLTVPIELILWVESLKLVPTEQWSPTVRADFESCLEADTVEWLATHRHLWSGPIPSRARPKLIDADGSSITVKIDVRTVDKVINERLASLIDVHRQEIGFTALKGRPTHDQRQAKYTFATRPDTLAWEIGLEALRTRFTGVQVPLWKTGEHLCRNYPIALKLAKQADGPDRRKELASLASRYINRTEKILKSIAAGTFEQ